MKAAIFVSVLFCLLVSAHSAPSIASNDVYTSPENTHETLKDFKKKAEDIHVNLQVKDRTQDYRIGRLETEYKEESKKISSLRSSLNSLTNKVYGARVYCYDTSTSWDDFSEAPIMFLDRQDVRCPSRYFVARFRLVREGGWKGSRVRYNYKCCKFIL
ncbi:uncharacterized protein LOC144656662 [Oculina patagonica]